jgi:hypothetical protein
MDNHGIACSLNLNSSDIRVRTTTRNELANPIIFKQQIAELAF